MSKQKPKPAEAKTEVYYNDLVDQIQMITKVHDRLFIYEYVCVATGKLIKTDDIKNSYKDSPFAVRLKGYL